MCRSHPIDRNRWHELAFQTSSDAQVGNTEVYIRAEIYVTLNAVNVKLP